MTDQERIITELKRLSINGKAPSSRIYDKTRHPTAPAVWKIAKLFGSYSKAVTAAGLSPASPGFPKGLLHKDASIDLATVDAEIKAETGWTPDLPFHLQRLAYLPSEGIPVSPPQVKAVWDWSRMTHVTCEVYAVR